MTKYIVTRWCRRGILLTSLVFVIYVFILGPNIPGRSLESKNSLASKHGQSAEKGIKVYNNEDLQLSRFDVTTIKLQFHPAFKNPCFLEYANYSKPWVYGNNKFITTSEYRKRVVLGSKLIHSLRYLKHGVIASDTSDLCKPGKGCRLRCLPYFMLIGAAKSGTSDFADRVICHPQIFGAINKELFYWTQFRFSLNATLGDYCDLFDKSVLDVIKERKRQNDKDFYPRILSEFTSQTLGDDIFWRESPKNKGLKEPVHLKIHDIYQVNPDVKIIAILRNPTSKVYSSYNMYRRKGVCTPDDFHQRILQSITWWENCTKLLGLPVRTCAYSCVPEMPPVLCEFSVEHNNRWGEDEVTYSGEILRALYSVFVKDWLSVFPRRQILFLRTEDSYNMSSVLNSEVFPFLDLEPVTENQAPDMFKQKHKHDRKYAPMLAETKQILDEFYEPFNKELADLLGNSKWLWHDNTPG